jgi:hypothetical protein
MGSQERRYDVKLAFLNEHNVVSVMRVNQIVVLATSDLVPVNK